MMDYAAASEDDVLRTVQLASARDFIASFSGNVGGFWCSRARGRGFGGCGGGGGGAGH